MPKRSLLLLATAMLACPLPAYADTVTIGYFDPAAGMSGIQVLGTASGTSPMVQLLGHPILPTGVTGFGFDQILAMVIPPGGNSLSGGLGGHVQRRVCAAAGGRLLSLCDMGRHARWQSVHAANTMGHH